MTTAELIPEYVQAAAIVVGGLWAYWRFFHQRGGQPATDIDVDLRFLGTQGDRIVVEVAATLENRSLVRHKYRNFRVRVRSLLPKDKIVDAPGRWLYQLEFPHSIDDRLRRSEMGESAHAERTFGTVDYINPRQRFQHRYPTFVPAEATFIWVHCRFDFGSGLALWLRRAVSRRQPPHVDSQKVFAVPGANAR